MLKNISSLGKTLNREQQQSISGGAPTPWDHPQNQQCNQPEETCTGIDVDDNGFFIDCECIKCGEADAPCY